jgi:CubicO group peptidase (beta-lactamase class C family)
MTVQADNRKERIDKLFEKYNKKGSAGASISIIENGKFVHQNSFGLADVRHESKITKNTVFPIASISKQFACFAVALLVFEGKLSLIKPIHEYLPEIRFKNITLLHLMQHTSGIRDYTTLATLRGEGRLFAFNRDHGYHMIKRQSNLAFPTGDSWDYTNSGYLLMEYIIESVTKVSFAEFMKKRIFEPLGMKDTFIFTDAGKPINNGAYQYELGSKNEMVYAPFLSENSGAPGGVFTTHEDFLKWDSNFYDNKLPGGQALIDLTIQPGKFNNGTSHFYAWGLIMKTWNGLKTISHNGGMAGVATDFYRFPQKKLTIFVTGNIGDTEIYSKAPKIATIWMGLQEDKKYEFFVPDVTLMNSPITKKFKKQFVENSRKYVGFYHQAELETVQEMYLREGQLYMNIKNLGEVPFILLHENYFKIGEFAIGRFLVDSNVVTGMIFINIPRAPMILWRKIPHKPICLN